MSLRLWERVFGVTKIIKVEVLVVLALAFISPSGEVCAQRKNVEGLSIAHIESSIKAKSDECERPREPRRRVLAESGLSRMRKPEKTQKKSFTLSQVANVTVRLPAILRFRKPSMPQALKPR